MRPALDGAWVRRLRDRLHITQQQLGELLDTSRTEVSQYETGKRKPSAAKFRILKAIEDGLARRPPSEVYPRGPAAADLSTDRRLALIFTCATGEVVGKGP